MTTKIGSVRRFEIDIGDQYVATVTLVPAGVPASDAIREDHDDRSLHVPCSSGSVWCDVHMQDQGAFAANAVFGADDEVVRCDTIDVMQDHQRKGIARHVYEIASCVFGAPVVPSGILSEGAKKFWAGQASIMAD